MWLLGWIAQPSTSAGRFAKLSQALCSLRRTLLSSSGRTDLTLAPVILIYTNYVTCNAALIIHKPHHILSLPLGLRAAAADRPQRLHL